MDEPRIALTVTVLSGYGPCRSLKYMGYLITKIQWNFYMDSCNHIYSAISSNLFFLWSWLSEWAVETVSDLFLAFTASNPSLSGILLFFLHSTVFCSKIPIAYSSSLVINIWTSSCPGISGGVLPEECSLIKWYRALYFHMVGASPETAGGHRGQWIGTFVHGLVLENSAAFLYCIPE